eukprot:m.5616 g.5616  ORF g.5616 m.5616 type:complete len:64 (-) comp4446_c0_seq1:129-320(-)
MGDTKRQDIPRPYCHPHVFSSQQPTKKKLLKREMNYNNKPRATAKQVIPQQKRRRKEIFLKQQ